MEESSGCKKTEAAETRLILVGKTGHGKSTLGNILLQKPYVKKNKTDTSSADQGVAVPSGGNEDQGFTVGSTFSSTTETCGYKESQAWGRRMKVIDTPGFFDTEQNPGKVLLELSKVMSLSTPGPHAVLFVTNCDVKFTNEEFDAYENMLKMFGKEIKQHLVLVFSRGDTLEYDTIEDRLKHPKFPSKLKNVMETVGDNYTVISKTNDPAFREKEVKQLLQKIDWVSKNGTECYTNDDLQKMTEEIVEEIEKLMKERNIGWAEAEYIVKKGLADEDERFRKLQGELIKRAVASVAFLAVVGVTGGVGAFVFAGATAVEATAGAGVVTFASIVATKFMEYLDYTKIKAKCRHENSGSCQIL